MSRFINGIDRGAPLFCDIIARKLRVTTWKKALKVVENVVLASVRVTVFDFRNGLL